MDARPLLTDLSEEDRALAMDRFHRLQPHLEDGIFPTQLAQAEGIPLRTAQRWVARYRRHGLAGLVRKTRRDHRNHRFPTELVGLVEGLALRRPRLPTTAIHRQVAALARQRDWPVPSYSTVYAFIQALDPGLVTLAHDGSKAYKERFDLLYRREVDHSNAVWLGDHTPLDIVVRDERGNAARPWFTVILDDYSRAVAGYRLSLQPP